MLPATFHKTADTHAIPVVPTAALANLDKPQNQRFYRPELDTLRFFAFLGVFAFHVIPHDADFYLSHHVLLPAAVPLVCAVSAAGAFGVDLFFALSAYLITTLLIREDEAVGHINIRAFYVRRILRIWPLYFFSIAVAALIPLWDHAQHLSWPYIAGFLLLAGNWVFVLKGLPHTIANPLWSISIEEQFYLLWPLSLRRISRRQLVVAAIVLLVLANVVRACLVFAHALGAAIEYNTFTRLDAIALGILVAYAFGEHAPTLSAIGRSALALSSLALWCTVAASTRLNAQTEVAPVLGTLLGRPLVAVAAAGLLVAVIGAPAAGARILTNSTLTYLGRISYGLYVYHMAGLLVADHLIRKNTVEGFAVYALSGLALTVIFSIVSYRWVESPFLRMKERFAVVRSRPV